MYNCRHKKQSLTREITIRSGIERAINQVRHKEAVKKQPTVLRAEGIPQAKQSKLMWIMLKWKGSRTLLRKRTLVKNNLNKLNLGHQLLPSRNVKGVMDPHMVE